MSADNYEIYVWPAELWNFYRAHMDELDNKYFVIAENKVTGREVILHTDSSKDSLGHIAVYDGDVLRYDEPFSGFDDAMITCRKVYGTYMVEAEEEESDDIDDMYCQDEIDRRETELYDALCDFMEIAGSCVVSDDDADELLDEVLALVSSYGYPVYRPMIEEVEGRKVFTEYPYDKWEEVPSK